MRAFGGMTTVALIGGCGGNDDTSDTTDANPDTDSVADTDTTDTDVADTDTDDTDTDDTDSDTDDTDDTDTDTDTDTDVPLVFADVDQIFAMNCDGCHWPNGNSGGFTFDGPEDVVSVPSNDEPGLSRIEPFSPDDSYLWHKVNGTQDSVETVNPDNGARMPFGAAMLGQSDLDLLEDWILDGALP